MRTCTLVADGPSDSCLIPIIQWTFNNLNADFLPRVELADLRPYAPGHSLRAKINAARQFYPCELLLIHRDAENQPSNIRFEEIRAAAGNLVYVPIVPVKMSESWLLTDERAIRIASGNPNGSMQLDMPRLNQIEGLRDPKIRLHELLTSACGRSGRHLRNFRPDERKKLVADNIADFTLLNNLPSYAKFRSDLIAALSTLPST
jgi:hypothetical protein